MSIILDALKKVQAAKTPSQEQKQTANTEGSGMFNPQSQVSPVNVVSQKRRVIVLAGVAIVVLGLAVFMGIGSKFGVLFSDTKPVTDKAVKSTSKVPQTTELNDTSDSKENEDKRINEINQLKADAAEKFIGGDYLKSVESYKKIVIKIADDPEVYNNYGLALKKLGKQDDAKRQYMVAITLKPDYAEALNNMAVIEITEGKYNEARNRLEAAVQTSPDYLDPYLHLAICLEKLGEVTGAMNNYTEFLKRSEGRSDLRKIRVQIEGRLARLSEDL